MCVRIDRRKRRRGGVGGLSEARSSAVPNLGGVYARPEILEIAVYFPAEGIELATLRVTPRLHPVVFLDGRAKPAARPPLSSPLLFHIAISGLSQIVSKRYDFDDDDDDDDGTSRTIRAKKWSPVLAGIIDRCLRFRRLPSTILHLP